LVGSIITSGLTLINSAMLDIGPWRLVSSKAMIATWYVLLSLNSEKSFFNVNFIGDPASLGVGLLRICKDVLQLFFKVCISSAYLISYFSAEDF
jgi:phage protein U